jgi:hypothetical protein
MVLIPGRVGRGLIVWQVRASVQADLGGVVVFEGGREGVQEIEQLAGRLVGELGWEQ